MIYNIYFNDGSEGVYVAAGAILDGGAIIIEEITIPARLCDGGKAIVPLSSIKHIEVRNEPAA